MKHSEIIQQLKTILTEEEYKSIKEIVKRSHSGTNVITVKFNDMVARDRIANVVRDNTSRKCFNIQTRYGWGFHFYGKK